MAVALALGEPARVIRLGERHGRARGQEERDQQERGALEAAVREAGG